MDGANFIDIESEYNFPVKMVPLFGPNGEEVSPKVARGLQRTDTGEILASHGASYKPLHHNDVVDAMLEAARSTNITKDFSVSIVVAENGRKLRGEISFDDITIEPEVGDYVKYTVPFFNSYDATWSASAEGKGKRLVCKNGMEMGLNVTRSRYKHTASLSLESLAATISRGLDVFHNQRDVWQSYIRTRLDLEAVEAFFKATLASTYSPTVSNSVNEKQLENLMQTYRYEVRNMGPTKWSLYNAITYWSSHPEGSRNPTVTQKNREDAVNRALASKAWAALV